MVLAMRSLTKLGACCLVMQHVLPAGLVHCIAFACMLSNSATANAMYAKYCALLCVRKTSEFAYVQCARVLGNGWCCL